MVTLSTASLLDDLRQYRLLDATQLEELMALQPRWPDPKALAKELIQRGWLTPFQANQLLQGRGQELLLGSYVLRARVGEGGMGQVFQARNWKLGRIVAVKLIRKDRLAHPDAVRRFQREVRAAAALSHPNIVLAYDADQLDGTHYLVMEYIDGAIDLAALVQKNGPLPVSQACDYLRQAALGLQHADECGLVHRDIKPQNLLCTADRKVVKILDMGLARLDVPAIEGDQSSTMTREGTIMGTVDYLSPEQARQSHTVDIRGDIYSLGCTFYFLLSGRVPFPGGTLLEKLLKHKLDEPKPVEQARPGVPPDVAAIVRKMMAKNPEDRYSKPADVAAALAALSTDRPLAEGDPIGATAPSHDTLVSPFASLATTPGTVGNASSFLRRVGGQRHWLWVGGAAGSLLLVGLVVLLVVLVKTLGRTNAPSKEKEPAVVNAPSKEPRKKIDEDTWLKQVAALPAEKQVKAVATRLMELNKGFDGKVTSKIDDNGVVTDLTFVTDHVTDISPLRALTKLQNLDCHGMGPDWQIQSQFTDLSPLQGLPLTYLNISRTHVADLSPLKDMPLTRLDCYWTEVSDLSPLADMKLTNLNCARSPVSDLSPLRMPLTNLCVDGTKVSDLAPIKDMKLTILGVGATPISDLSDLKEMKLTGLNCGWTKVSDLSPLKDMPLTDLSVASTPVSDLSPLKNLPLTNLSCGWSKVSDLSPLKDMKLTHFHYIDAPVADVSPLQGMPLKVVECSFKPERDAALLHSLTTLETINKKPVKDFWKEVDQMKPDKKP